MTIRITVEDTKTKQVETAEIPENDYFILTTGTCHVEHTQVYPKTGTHQLTIKGRLP